MRKKEYESRDLIYGFITFDDWEREVINHPVFQRLRRIRQLSLTDMVYPGAGHTRFEHSLGVMHLASLIFESIVKKRKDFLESELGFNDDGLRRDRKILRFAALLHDIGHSPFSHAGEELMPLIPEDHRKYVAGKNKRFSHEDYSIEIIKTFLKDVIEQHRENDNYNIKVEDITALLGDETVKPTRSLIWKEIISSQLDADRADYLLRDSMHLGIRYGIYDKDRLVNTVSIAKDQETYGTNLVVEEGGWHVAESLVIARYQMFSQVYFHKTRRAYDHHIENAIKAILLKNEGSGLFPLPDNRENLIKYIDYDDWKIYGLIKEGMGGDDGQIILERVHDKCVHETSEVPDESELKRFEEVWNEFKDEISFDDSPEKSWYKTGKEDILILCDPNERDERLEPLSKKSSIVRAMQPIKQRRLYAKNEESVPVRKKIKKYLEGKK